MIPGEIEFTRLHQEQLKQMLGACPIEMGLKARLRLHQGWWRAFVLGLPQGDYYNQETKRKEPVCNRIKEGIDQGGSNFLTDNIRQAVAQTIDSRKGSDPGMIQEGRLNNNLLSSQPLVFNFFGELMIDKSLGLRILQNWWPDISALTKVFFEFAPPEKYSNDNSAFDVAFEVEIGNLTGLIGLECKYSDSFSSTIYRKPEYFKLYSQSHSFKASYEELTSSTFNQLFRNQLLAEGMIQHHFKGYSFVKTGLFCYPDDHKAIQTGKKFQALVNDGPEVFKIITYKDFIEKSQRLELSWDQREWIMLLWARYLGVSLSKKISNIR